MSDIADLNYRWAWSLLDALAAAGVKRVVASPGSRSTPLTLAALRHPRLMAEMVVDERSAAFMALGLSKAAGRPAVLIATSGSAVANWLPAVVEADMGRVPLILLSADRPPELHDCGANQTMEQAGLFGTHVRAVHALPPAEAGTGWLSALAGRVMTACREPLPGPVHVNVPFREPLVPNPAAPPAIMPPPRSLGGRIMPSPETVEEINAVMDSGFGAIVCGAEPLGQRDRAAVIDLAFRLRVPVFADLLSGLRCDGEAGAEILAHPDTVARQAPNPAWLLRLGGMPVSKALSEWMARAEGCPQIAAATHPRSTDAIGTATHRITADIAQLCHSLQAAPAKPDWLEGFVALDHASARAAEAACGDAAPFEGNLLRALFQSLPPDTPLFLGNSLGVRAADWFAGRRANGPRLFANRGLSGIDGNLSTALGIAMALGPSVAVMGDIAFQHDLGALASARLAPLVTVVLDNGGGGIFDHLAQAELPEFESGWRTPQCLDPMAAAAAFGLPAHRVEDAEALAPVVAEALRAGKSRLIHVPIDPALSRRRIRAFQFACKQGA